MTHELSRELLSGIIAALGSDWRLVPLRDENDTWERHSPRQLEYVGDDPLLTGAALYLYLKGEKDGRLNICGNLHATDNEYLGNYIGRDTSDAFKRTISVSLGKTPETIAKDITRRLLPGYLAGFKDAVQKLQGYHARYNRANELAAHFASLLGAGASVHGKAARNSDVSVSMYGPGQLYLSMRVAAEGPYIERFHGLSIAQAEEFCEMLARWRDQASKGQHVDVRV